MKIFFTITLLLCTSFLFAQNDLLSELEKSNPSEKNYTYATFKGTRLVNLHTVETLSKGTLEFRIAHRFGPLSSGLYNFYGLDGPATIQLRLDYAVTDRLLLGIGRTSDRKMVDGFVKYKWLRQTADGSMPITVTALGSANVTAEKNTSVNNRYAYFSNRLAYLTSVMVGRKFSPEFSAQISPILIHYNLVDQLADKNDMLSIGTQARYKFTRSTAITAEYILRATPYVRDMSVYKNVLSLGFDIETGGHVFQVFLTNGYSINEVLAIPYTTSSWTKGEMRLGFNISRTFDIGSREKEW